MDKTKQPTSQETTQANFRVLPETANKFREFCKENGLNQAQAFDHIMQVVELSYAREKMVTRGTEIDEFERHIKALMSAYTSSLQLAENADARMLDKYEGQLSSKDETIQTLQAEKKRLESQIDVVRGMRDQSDREAKDAKRDLETALREKDSAENAAKDKEEINKMLEKRLIETEEKAKAYDALKAEADGLRQQVDELGRQMEKEGIEAERRQERAVQQVTDEKESAIRNLERENSRLNAQLEQEKASLSAKIAAAQLEVEKGHSKEIKELYSQIDDLRKENVALTKQVVDLQAKKE